MPDSFSKQEQECMTLKQMLKKNMKVINTFCPYCRRDAESFEHIFKCHDGLICPFNTHGITLKSFTDVTDARFLKRVGKYLLKYEKFREVVI